MQVKFGFPFQIKITYYTSNGENVYTVSKIDPNILLPLKNL